MKKKISLLLVVFFLLALAISLADITASREIAGPPASSLVPIAGLLLLGYLVHKNRYA